MYIDNSTGHLHILHNLNHYANPIFKTLSTNSVWNHLESKSRATEQDNDHVKPLPKTQISRLLWTIWSKQIISVQCSIDLLLPETEWKSSQKNLMPGIIYIFLSPQITS